MAKKVSEKMGIKEDARSIFVNAPVDAVNAIRAPRLNVAARLSGDFDYIHFFARHEVELQKKFSSLKKHLKPTGMLWISWPKAGQQESDLNMHSVIKTGYDFGLVESKALSVNATWSALKFTHPKKGKVYKNSFGKLKK
jgi:hypothetical protein